MALSTVYDSVLSRVRISGTGLTVTDSFTRTVVGGWGNADTGQAWTANIPADFAVNTGQGRVTPSATGSDRVVTVDTGSADHECQVVLETNTTPVGGIIRYGTVIRFTDTANFLGAVANVSTGGVVTAEVFSRVGGVFTVLASVNTGLSIGTNVIVKARVVGLRVQLKVWHQPNPEPSTWTIDITDTTVPLGTRCGAFGRREAGNTSPTTLDFDSFSAFPVVTVQRSTNQVTWIDVRGGKELTPISGAISLDDYEFTADVINYYRAAGQIANITPVLDGVWLKSLARPFLNRKVTPRDFSPMTRASRGGVFPIVGRSAPIAVTELHGSRRWTLELNAYTDEEAEALDLLISTGEVQFIHVPTTGRLAAVPSGYVALGDTAEEVLPTIDLKTRVFSLSLTQVVAPGPDVIPAIGLWSTVINTYASWNAVLAAHPSWSDLLQLAGSSADVVVP